MAASTFQVWFFESCVVVPRLEYHHEVSETQGGLKVRSEWNLIDISRRWNLQSAIKGKIKPTREKNYPNPTGFIFQREIFSFPLESVMFDFIDHVRPNLNHIWTWSRTYVLPMMINFCQSYFFTPSLHLYCKCLLGR